MAPIAVVPKSGPKALSAAANLANLLPTGTVLAFQALVPTLTDNGKCLTAHKYLTLGAIICCSIACFASSFIDSFLASNGKLYYGIATPYGLYIFNKDEDDEDDANHSDKDVEDGEGEINNNNENNDDKNDNDNNDESQQKQRGECNKKEFLGKHVAKYKIRVIDFVHAFASLLVFLVFAIGSSDVQNCFFPHPGPNGNALMINLPLGVGVLASLLFMIFPTKRRGIGYADKGHQPLPQTPESSPSTRMHLRR